MGNYLSWDAININDFSDKNVNSLYNEGYLFTRTGKGDMYQTRSLRINLGKFELTSENRRVLKKTEDLGLRTYDIPYDDYSWEIGKLAKDFYTTKFGEGTFSANKVKELLTTEHNFNKLYIYYVDNENNVISNWKLVIDNKPTAGLCIVMETDKIIHYSYPFYQLPITNYQLPNLGMSMMLHAILYAQKQNKKYIYLGSIKDSKAKYKLQFEGLEWFDGKVWQTNIDELKNNLR